jgi:DNA polymerase-3 subunit delta'
LRFEEIRGQETAIATLRRAIRGEKVPHAYLFTGPAGVGKALAARALAMALNCEEAGDDGCGACLSCTKTARGIHPDLITVGLPEKKKRIPIDAVRELERSLLIRPHEGRVKLAIIDPADALTDAAANALLKTLEEPRPGAYLVLVTARASALLPTVRSRCQLVRFRPLATGTVRELLSEGGHDGERAAVAAALSGGSLDQAEAYLSEELEPRLEKAFEIFGGALEPTPARGLGAIAALGGKRDDCLALLELMHVLLEELLWTIAHPGGAEDRLLKREIGPRFDDILGGVPVARAAGFVAAVHNAAAGVRDNNMNPQLALEGMLMSMRDRAGDSLGGSGFGGA